jgi:hypothetical protein
VYIFILTQAQAQMTLDSLDFFLTPAVLRAETLHMGGDRVLLEAIGTICSNVF